MRDSKIRITSEDIVNAEPAESYGSYVSPEYQANQPPSKGAWKAVVLLLSALVLVLGIIGTVVLRKSPGNGDSLPISIEEYCQQQIAAWNAELSDQDSELFSQLKRRIEDAHATVDVISAQVIRYNASTYNGSRDTGNNGDNVDQENIHIRFDWTGIVDAGYSVLQIVIDRRTRAVVKSGIVDTSALVNTEDPEFWYGLGEFIGLALTL